MGVRLLGDDTDGHFGLRGVELLAGCRCCCFDFFVSVFSCFLFSIARFNAFPCSFEWIDFLP